MEERHTKRLRSLLARPACLVAPGVADALAARMVARGPMEAPQPPIGVHRRFHLIEDLV